MKNMFLSYAAITIMLIASPLLSLSQSFFVEKTQEGFEQPIIDKLLELGKDVTTKETNSTYTIRCLISKTGMGRAKGSVLIIETQSGNVLIKSKEVNGQTSAFNGYANPKMRTMKKLAADNLEEILAQIKEKTNK